MSAVDQDHTITGHEHPETSVQAAARFLGKSGGARRRVMAALAEIDHTDEELQRDLRMPANTQRPRRVELVDWGLVEPTSARRRGVSGSWSTVWAATEVGRRALTIDVVE